jgi:uncharacterized protein (DUF169 family)
MKMNHAEIAAGISSRLQLTSPLIGVSFVEQPPIGMATFEGEVPSACTFWRKAEAGVFYVPAEKHFNCPIGAMTMGFDMPGEVRQQLMGIVEMMTGAGYISADEVANIPSVKRKKSGIVYGPLNSLPMQPDLVLMWLTPRQAMIYSEASGNCRWMEMMPAALGRPSCGALPVALEKSQPALSLGCLGMRIFTEVAEDQLLGVIPGNGIENFFQALIAKGQANQAMGEFYTAHKARFAS